jgi:hypothetical protein
MDINVSWAHLPPKQQVVKLAINIKEEGRQFTIKIPAAQIPAKCNPLNKLNCSST